MFEAALQESMQYEGSTFNTEPIPNEHNDYAQCNQPIHGQMHQMVIDAASPSVFPHAEDASNCLEEDPNPEAQRMFDRLACASKPLYLGCDVSQLAAATALLNIKAQFNMPERGYNLISEWSHWWAPSNTTLPDSLYNMKKISGGTWFAR